jgi:hypothetical protein
MQNSSYKGAKCQDIFNFLNGIKSRSISSQLLAVDLNTLQQLNIVRFVTPDQQAQLANDVQRIEQERQAVMTEQMSLSQSTVNYQEDMRKTHSILFHLEGSDKKQADLQRESQDRAAVQSLENDIMAKERDLQELVEKRSFLDTLTPYSGGFVALTGLGLMQLRDMSIKLYRYSDIPFSTYWAETQQMDGELNGIATTGGQYFNAISPSMSTSNRGYLWAIAITLAKMNKDIPQTAGMFLDSYKKISKLSPNEENRMMSAEILSAQPNSIDAALPILESLQKDVRSLGVPKESSLGVASILLFGRRADGTFATPILESFLPATKSYESAALLAIVNKPFEELVQKFQSIRAMFNSWGFGPSEDLELSSCYLTLSELPMEGMSTKLSIITKGMSAYLQYPLVASSILASIPVWLADETLNLLEKAYGIIGRIAMPLSQAELICLAVRMLHGIQSETTTGLDSTGVQRAAMARAGIGRPFYYMPMVMVVHSSYYSTYSGIGGMHPAHTHVAGPISVG